MGIKKGTKLTDTPKDISYYIRVDSETDEKAKAVCEKERISKSELVRQGIELKYRNMEENKMKVKILFKSDNKPVHMVVQGVDGQFCQFLATPVRKITENDLKPLPHYIAKGKQAEEAEPYMYQIYGLEKE